MLLLVVVAVIVVVAVVVVVVVAFALAFLSFTFSFLTFALSVLDVVEVLVDVCCRAPMLSLHCGSRCAIDVAVSSLDVVSLYNVLFLLCYHVKLM